MEVVTPQSALLHSQVDNVGKRFGLKPTSSHLEIKPNLFPTLSIVRLNNFWKRFGLMQRWDEVG